MLRPRQLHESSDAKFQLRRSNSPTRPFVVVVVLESSGIRPIEQVRFDPLLFNDFLESKSTTGSSPSTALPLFLAHDFNNRWYLKKPAEVAREPICWGFVNEANLPLFAVDRRTFAP